MLRLTGSSRLKHFRLGTKVVIDLQKAAPAAASPPAAVPAESLPRAKVRGGRQDGSSRPAPDWESPVGESLPEAPGRSRMSSDRHDQFVSSVVNPACLPTTARLRHTPDGVTIAIPPSNTPDDAP